jgi:glycerophosphoryl diester phosphodiesterase
MIGFAHRGGMADAPENTLVAFRNALEQGANGLESDIWLGSHGEPVLSHGKPGPEAVELAELFAACGTDFELSLDMKGPGAAARTIEVASEAGFDLTRLWLCGGSLSCLPWRALSDEVKLVTDMRWRDAVFRPRRTMEKAAHAGVNAVNLRHGRWTKRLIRYCHDQGMRAFGWDVQFGWTLRRAARRGLDGVYSDKPRLLVEVLPR